MHIRRNVHAIKLISLYHERENYQFVSMVQLVKPKESLPLMVSIILCDRPNVQNNKFLATTIYVYIYISKCDDHTHLHRENKSQHNVNITIIT